MKLLKLTLGPVTSANVVCNALVFPSDIFSKEIDLRDMIYEISDGLEAFIDKTWCYNHEDLISIHFWNYEKERSATYISGIRLELMRFPRGPFYETT